MMKLKLQYFGHLTQRADSFEKTLWTAARQATYLVLYHLPEVAQTHVH